jgi:hypothetical protein
LLLLRDGQNIDVQSKARRTEAYFLQTAENHARNENTRMMPCPCKTCKNMRVFSDTTIIRSHVLVDDFVENCMIWMYHGKLSNGWSTWWNHATTSLTECLMLRMILKMVPTMMMLVVDFMVMASMRGPSKEVAVTTNLMMVIS